MSRSCTIYFPFLIIIVLLSTILVEDSKAAPIRLVALNVGEGQSIVVVDQEHGILIDTGHTRYAPHILSRVKAYGVRQLDYLILTHLHPDHAGGYFYIRKAFPQIPVLNNCHPIIASEFTDQGIVRRLHDALNTDNFIRCVKGGDKLSWQGHQLEFLWPYHPEGPDLNHHSLVLQIVSNNGKRLLIMGDVDRRVEGELSITRQEEWKNQGVDVFVAGHHGAADTGNEHFLELIGPQFTIVSVNENNQHYYPSKKTLQTLEKHSRFLFRTDRDGEICIVLSDQPQPCKETKTISPQTDQ